MVTVSRRILVSAPKETVRLYLQDLKNMADYEQKVERVEAVSGDASGGTFEAAGKFLGLPWRGTLKASYTRDGGYRSEMVRGPIPGAVWGFHLKPVAGGTLVIHEERYPAPLPLRPVLFLLKGRIGHGMELELGVIKEGAERLHRQIMLREIEASL